MTHDDETVPPLRVVQGWKDLTKRAEDAEALVKEYSARMILVRKYCHDCLGAQMTAMPLSVLALLDGKPLP